MAPKKRGGGLVKGHTNEVRHRGEQAADEGFFKKLFGGSAKGAAAAKYQISVRSVGDKTTVSVLNDLGSAELSDTAQKIIKVLADDLK